MQVSDPPFIGDWVREKKLGAGGFGVVTLWRNTKSDQCVAVKRCHPPADGANQHAETIRRRWNLEVDYMTQKVSHPNIVRGIRAEPAAFLAQLERLHPGGMPVLLMEYCEGGDLRRLLNTSEYATGFAERETRDILRSLGAAIAHLHSMKITHRDIKPENIVVKRDPATGEQVYKLTDLGYAKALDHQTLVASLVGTLEYVAPELCLTDRYTNTVDYWSLGVIAYEICTGVRPFVPHLPLARWMPVVQKKKSAHIAITEGQPEQSIRYESALPAETRLSAELARLLAEWLQLAVEWNPRQRGHVFKQQPALAAADNEASKANQLPPQLELRIFSQLDSILRTRILRVFCLHSRQEYSCQLAGVQRMDELLIWLSRVCRYEQPINVRMVLPIEHPFGDEIQMSTQPAQLWWPDHDGPMIYVYQVHPKLGGAGKRDAPDEMPLPEVVRQVLGNKTCKWRPHVVRQFATAAYHACRSAQRAYCRTLAGWHSLALQMDHLVALREQRVEEMQRQVYQLSGAVRLLGETMKLVAPGDSGGDVDEELQQIGSAYAVQAKRAQEMLTACERVVRRYKSVKKRSSEACGRKVLDGRTVGAVGDVFGVEQMGKALEILRIQLQQKASVELQLREMQHAVEVCAQRRTQLMEAKEWQRLAELAPMSFEVEEISKTIDKAIETVKPCYQDILALNVRLFQSLKSPVPAYLPAIEGIGSTATATANGMSKSMVNFAIGKEVTPPKQICNNGLSASSSASTVVEAPDRQSLLSLGNMEAGTLISNNKAILFNMKTMMEQLNQNLLNAEAE